MSITKFTRPFYSVCSKCPPFALMQARRHLQKLGIDFLIASCYSSSHIRHQKPYLQLFFGCGFRLLFTQYNYV